MKYALRTARLSSKSHLLFRYLLTETSRSHLPLDFYCSAFVFQKHVSQNYPQIHEKVGVGMLNIENT